MEYLLPNNTDNLFIDEKDYYTGAWIKKHHGDKFFLYSQGYKQAGKLMYDFCMEQQSPVYNNLLVYPMVFAYRQYLELRLKELILMGGDYLDDSVSDFPDEHSLMKLWNIYRNQILVNIEQIKLNVLNNVERLISQFNTEDPQSMVFRYPVTRGPLRKISLNRDTIHIENFKNVMDKLIYFFEWQWDMITHYKELRNDMIADMYRDYWQ